MCSESQQGEAFVEKAFLELQWLYRRQPIADYGIDGHAEVCAGKAQPLGRLLGVQVKTGKSYFSEDHGDKWCYRPKKKHREYWLNHALPVILVLCDLSEKTAYWQIVNEETLIEGPKGGLQLLVPKDQKLDFWSNSKLKQLAKGKPAVAKLQDLRAADPWIRMLASGDRLVLDVTEWINKTSGRGELTLSFYNENSGKFTPLERWHVFMGSKPYEEALPQLLPWATLQNFETIVEDHLYDRWQDECVFVDEEYGITFQYEDFDSWKTSVAINNSIMPYSNGANEVDYWKLELMLNDLGHAYLKMADFLDSPYSLALTPNRL